MEASKTATEIDSRVTCQRGGPSVICAYKQNLLTGRDPARVPGDLRAHSPGLSVYPLNPTNLPTARSRYGPSVVAKTEVKWMLSL
jgi:hypothetical protein